MSLAIMKQPKAQTPKQVVVEWIEEILDRKGLNGTELARKANLAPSTLLRLLNDPKHDFTPTLKTLRKISEGGGMPITKKVMDAIGVVEELQPIDMSSIIPSRRRARVTGVEFRHVSALPAALQSTASAKREVPAPPQIEGDETAFAFNMPDDSMSPFIRAGTLCYATKRRDPSPSDLIVVTGKDGKTKVRFLMGLDESGVKMSKDGSTQEDVMEFDNIKDIAIVAVIVRTV